MDLCAIEQPDREGIRPYLTPETAPDGADGYLRETKLVGEDLAELFHAQTGVSKAATRLFNVYGTKETNEHLIPTILEQVRDGKRQIEVGNLYPNATSSTSRTFPVQSRPY